MILAFLAAALDLASSQAPALDARAGTDWVILGPDANWSYFAAIGSPKKGWKVGAGKSGWKKGALPIGYEMSGLSTIFTTVSEPSKKFPVAYFRKIFELPKQKQPLELSFMMGCDDGCIVYLNGVELYRLRMPNNAPAHYGAETHNHETVTIAIPAKDLRPGRNILAVEVHQRDASSSDMRFEASLKGKISAK